MSYLTSTMDFTDDMSVLAYCDKRTVMEEVDRRQGCTCTHTRCARMLSILLAQVDSVSKPNCLNLEMFKGFIGCYSTARTHSVL